MRFGSLGMVAVFLALALTPRIGDAGKARFSEPPVIGDRRISWSWEPLPPGTDTLGVDPYFEGNTVLEPTGAVPHPVPGRLRILRASPDGARLYGVGSLSDRVYVWNPTTGAPLDTLGAPPSRLMALDVHASGRLLVGGLEDGRIALWDLRTQKVPQIFDAQTGPCTQVHFLISSQDPTDQRFITAGREDTVRIWNGPGVLRPPKLVIAADSIVSMAVTTNGAVLALGDPGGSIRFYAPLRPKDEMVQRLTGHQGAVRQLCFSVDRRRLVSADDTGKLIVWYWSTRSLTWVQLFEHQLERSEAPLVGIRDPDAGLVYTLDSQAFYQILDGNTDRIYRSTALTEPGNLEIAMFGQLGRQILIGTADRSILGYRTGFCQPTPTDLDCFGGYKIWRSLTPLAKDAVLLRIFGFGDSTWTFSGNIRSFVDPDSLIPHGSRSETVLSGPTNGIPYYYSVTGFARRFLNGSVFDVGDDSTSIQEGFYRADGLEDSSPTPVAAHSDARQQQPLLADVIVVPNPYEAGKVPWDRELGEHVEFRNLPERATIRIYTVAGDLLRELRHGGGESSERSDTHRWDLTNGRQEKVASGVYVYHITTPLNSEETSGYFLVIR